MQNNAKTVISCECGSCMLEAQVDTDEGVQYYYLAMFYFGGDHREKFWRRLKIAWKFLRTGKMYRDQLCLTPEEALKLADFIHLNIKQDGTVLG